MELHLMGHQRVPLLQEQQTIGKGPGWSSSVQVNSIVTDSRTHQSWGHPVISHLIYRNLPCGFHHDWSHSWALWRNKSSFRKTSLCDHYAVISLQFESKSSAPEASFTPTSSPSPAICIYLVYFWRQNKFYMPWVTFGEIVFLQGFPIQTGL